MPILELVQVQVQKLLYSPMYQNSISVLDFSHESKLKAILHFW